MPWFIPERLLAAALIAPGALLALSAPVALADEAPAPSSPAPARAATGTDATEPELGAVEVIARRIDAARNTVRPEGGATAYSLTRDDLDALPTGAGTGLNEVLARTPGVARDSFGGIHLRGDHGNLQYRINGIMLPEAIAGFGQALDARIASEITVLSGALPAQYGLRTAGVVDIRTRDGSFEQEGSVNVTAGGRNHRETGADASGQRGRLSWFMSGSLLATDLGIESPTARVQPLHDRGLNEKGLAYLAWALDDTSKLALLLGASDNRFQIPNSAGLAPRYAITGMSIPPSAAIDARQRETGSFQTVAWQRSVGQDEWQVALFHRYSAIDYRPDLAGDLAYNGIASRISRSSDSSGLQVDGAWALSGTHRLRAGLLASSTRYGTLSSALVLPADANGNQTGTLPLGIEDNHSASSQFAGVYVQDEWRASSRLTVNLGARLDAVSAVLNEHQVSPRANLVYEWDRNTRLHAGYARYFTPPASEKIDSTSVALYQGTTNALPGTGNAPLRAERSNSWDAGLSHQLSRQLTLGLDTYYRDVRHLHDEGQFGNALIYSGFNYAQGRIYGSNLSLAWHDETLSAWLNAGYLVARATTIETGQFNFAADELAWIGSHWIPLDHDQRWSLSGGLAWRQGKTTWSSDAIYATGLRRTPEGASPNSDHLPAYLHMNAAVTQAIARSPAGPIDLRFTVVNVFDKVYALRDGTGVGVGAPQFGPRRTFLASIIKRF
jgi:outer membrane receptor protein involved in Fe transport